MLIHASVYMCVYVRVCIHILQTVDIRHCMEIYMFIKLITFKV